MKNGFILLDKPGGITSRQADRRVAKIFGARKFGHMGTLDPMASGLLIIALGEATKMIPFLDEFGSGIKEYVFSAEWGVETDTLDTTGNIIKRDETACPPPAAEIDEACRGLVGEIDQVPPAYSAIHVGGRRAYDLARRGEAVDIPSRKVRVFSLARIAENDRETVFLAQCSAGTYVRSLARDIGKLVGRINAVSMIRRTKTHGFDVKDADGLAFLENMFNNTAAVGEYLKPLDFGLDGIPVAELDDGEAALFENGGVVATKNGPAGLRRVYSGGRFIGIGSNGSCALAPKRVIKYKGS